MDSKLDTGPGLNFPPPTVYCVGFIIARSLDYFVPIAEFPFFWPRVVVGSLLLAIGILACWWAMTIFRKHDTGLMPNTRATDLVRIGPYRYSRNPMYVTLFIQYIGISLALGSIWAFILIPVVFLFVRWIVVREEQYLADEFGDSYKQFTSEVRRWL